MKRLVCAVLVFTLLFTAAACGSSRGRMEAGAKSGPAGGLLSGPSSTGSSSAAGLSVSPGETETEAASGSLETSEEGAEEEKSEMKLKIQVGDAIFTATLAENSSVDALMELMADGPLTLDMSDYANMEKGADLGFTLPQNNEQMNTGAGDIILYQGRTFVIYYGTNSWSLTPIGKIDNVDAGSLKAALGDGDVTVTLSLK